MRHLTKIEGPSTLDAAGRIDWVHWASQRVEDEES